MASAGKLPVRITLSWMRVLRRRVEGALTTTAQGPPNRVIVINIACIDNSTADTTAAID